MAPKAAAFILLFIFALGIFAGASAHVSAGADALSLDGELRSEALEGAAQYGAMGEGPLAGSALLLAGQRGECVCCEWLDNPFVLNRGASGSEFAFAVSIQ